MVSKDQKMLEIFSTLKLIADSDCIVLIEGATGTGKELLAKAVHNNSLQKKWAVCTGQLRGPAGYAHRV
jgi:transcriptional regulator with PAS, ATPase and Fis domain